MLNKSKRKADNEMSKVNNKSLTKIVISIAIAVVVFIGATLLESYILTDKQTTDVYIAVNDIESGTIINDENMDQFFIKESVKSSLATKNAYKAPTSIKGKTVTNIDKGEIATSNMFLDTQAIAAKVIDPVEVTFSAKDVENSVVGSLREGDTVDIIATYKKDGDTEETISVVAYENVYVIKSYDESYKAIDSTNKDASAMYFKIRINKGQETAFATMLTDAEVTVAKTNVKE